MLFCTTLIMACEPPPDARYRTGSIQKDNLAVEVVAVGTVQPLALTKVSTQLSGQVASVLVDFNDVVTKGQLLAQLDEQSFTARLDEAQAQLEVARNQFDTKKAGIQRARARIANRRAEIRVLQSESDSAAALHRMARAELKRISALADRSSASVSQLDEIQYEHESTRALLAAAEARLGVQDTKIGEAEADLAMAQAQVKHALAMVRQQKAAVDEAQLNLERTAIRSPLDGVVISRDVEPGQTVAASLQAPTLFSLAGDLRSMQVETQVDEADIGRIRVGQPVRFQVDAYPENVFKGVVRKIHIAPRMVQNVVTYNVLADAPNPDRSLLPGMTALVRIQVAQHADVLLLPNAALRFTPPPDWITHEKSANGSNRIWLLPPSGPIPVDVVLGPSNERVTMVRKGPIKAGDRVITGAGVGTPPGD